MANSLGFSTYHDVSASTFGSPAQLNTRIFCVDVAEGFGVIGIAWRGAASITHVKLDGNSLTVVPNSTAGTDFKVAVYSFTTTAGRHAIEVQFSSAPTWAASIQAYMFAAHASGTIEDVSAAASVTSRSVTASAGAIVLEFFSEGVGASTPDASQTSMLFNASNARVGSIAVAGDSFGASFKAAGAGGAITMTRNVSGAMVALSVKPSGNTVTHPTDFYFAPAGSADAPGTAASKASIETLLGINGDILRFLRSDETLGVIGRRLYGATGVYSRSLSLDETNVYPTQIFGSQNFPIEVIGEWGAELDGVDAAALKRTWGNGAVALHTSAYENNQYSELTYGGASSSGVAGPGVRISSTADRRKFTGYFADYDVTAGKVRLWKYVNQQLGFPGTQLGSDVVTTLAATDKLRVEANGTTIRVLKNGAQILSVTDSAIASGKAGIVVRHDIDNTTGGYLEWTLWGGGDLDGALNVYSDNFTRADNTALGGSWTESEDVNTVIRILSNTLRVAQTTQAAVYNGVHLMTTGQWVHWIGWRCRDSSADTRQSPKSDGRQPIALSRRQGITVSRGGKVSHCFVEDLIDGIDKDNNVGYEDVYQCVVSRIGWQQGVGTGAGHAYYWENKTDGEPARIIESVAGPCFGFAQIYGAGSGANHDVQTMRSMFLRCNLIWGGNGGIVSDDGLCEDCYFYDSDLSAGFASGGKQDFELRKGLFWQSLIQAWYWDRLVLGSSQANAPRFIRGGTIVSQRNLGAGPHSVVWLKVYNANGSHAMFERYTGVGDAKVDETLSQYKTSTGFLSGMVDGDLFAGLPTNEAIVLPSTVDPNRGVLYVLNFDGSASVNADLAALGWNIGDDYELRWALDPFNKEGGSKNVVTGTLSSLTLAVNMQSANYTVAKPLGWATALGTVTIPDIAAFAIRRTSQVPVTSAWSKRRFRHV